MTGLVDGNQIQIELTKPESILFIYAKDRKRIYNGVL